MVLGRSRLNLKIAWEKMMSKNSIPPIKFKTFLNHWSYTELKEIKDVRDGTHSSPKYIDNGYPLVTSKNLTDSGLNLNDVSLISESDYNEINKRSKVEVGDILLGLIGTIGKPVLVETDGFAIKNVGLIKNGGQIQNQFLLQYLKTNLFNKYIQIEMAGNTQKFLGLETLRNTKVPVPSPDEQSAIGSLFRTLDDLLASYKDNLANYQSLKATMLSKMFPKAGQTVPEIRLAGFEGDWELIKLGEVCDLITKGTTAKSQSEKGKVNFVKVENLKENEIYPVVKISEEEHLGSLKRSILFEGDILFSIAGTLGRTAIVRNNILPANTNQALAIIRGYKLDTYFLLVVLSGEVVKDYIRKNPTVGAQPNLSLEQVSSLKIQVPSIEEQQAIGSYFSNLNNLINSHQEKISQLETLKKKLLQDMFV